MRLLYYLGETYRRLGKFKESLTYFNEAIAFLDPSAKDYYLPLVGRTLVYYKLGDKEKARENIAKAEEVTKGFERSALKVRYYREILGL